MGNQNQTSGFSIKYCGNHPYKARKIISHNEPSEFDDGEDFHITIHADTDEKADKIAKQIMEIFK